MRLYLPATDLRPGDLLDIGYIGITTIVGDDAVITMRWSTEEHRLAADSCVWVTRDDPKTTLGGVA